MKNGFTIIEVSILFVIFMIVAFLVVPLSIDDTIQAKYTSKWKSVQQDFSNIYFSISNNKETNTQDFITNFETSINNEVKNDTKVYKIKYMNGSNVNTKYQFTEFKQTYANAIVSTKYFETTQDGIKGILMYDVNGHAGPNTWGKDIFGLNIYENYFEPIGKNESIGSQRQDCSKNGTGIFCSNYYLIGGNFD